MAAYNFVSHWHIAATAQTTGEALLYSEDWVHWWPGLVSVDALNGAVRTGAQYACVWKSGVGYSLKLVVTITEFIPGKSVAFTAEGDLLGEGSFVLDRTNGATTDIIIRWNADTTKSWMKRTAPLFRPLFVFLHHRLMRAGERGLNRYIARK